MTIYPNNNEISQGRWIPENLRLFMSCLTKSEIKQESIEQCIVKLVAPNSSRRGSRGGNWKWILEVKIIKNVKKILEINGEKRLALKGSQEIRTETRISHFNLKGDLVGKIYVWGDIWGDMFRIIHVKGMCSALYTVKCNNNNNNIITIIMVGIFGGDMFRII